ncbi:Threonine/homoserine efflux transporter RhtA [Cupriavidus sp. YR651]|uniref:DMT family transporter n=1 Tax=Cupriavidus sp. YR651 TaxID=1855315 RepID=UPI00088F62C6|nr:DMT family transporter [Cupriavidus sp. YR651]SDC63331.1 Threonine/homoserine efflux transporter RhtA [Cupriavidus sp. YR651]
MARSLSTLPAAPATAALTALAMAAFAANSLLARLALKGTGIDAATFTLVRIASAAVVLMLILRVRGGQRGMAGDWPAAVALLVYACGFSFAYLRLSAGTGALILFACVQATMIGHGLWQGDRLRAIQWLGTALALAGLVWLVLPGLQAPPPGATVMMAAAGIGWGVYSLRGKRAADALAATAGNFVRAVPLAVAISAAALPMLSVDLHGVLCGIASGAVTSGVGYVIWYAALRGLSSTTAATVQLSVPVLAALGGIAWLGEPMTARLAVGASAILGGIALIIVARRR